MKKSNRKGFTIVELVIVIAVIAILAAVLIPTFTNLIKKANESSDVQAVRQMNTFLTTDGAVTPTTPGRLFAVLSEGGFNAENYTPLVKDRYFFWDRELNIILYMDKDGTVLFPKNATPSGSLYNLSGSTTLIGQTATIALPAAPEANDAVTETKFTVANGADFVEVAEFVKQYQTTYKASAAGETLVIELTANIDLQGADINFTDTETTGMNVIFKSNDPNQIRTITGLYISDKHATVGKSSDGVQSNDYGHSLFYYVKNLTVENIHIDYSVIGGYEASQAGFFAGQVQGNATFTNVFVTNSDVQGNRKVGVLCGYTHGTLSFTNVNIDNCTVSTAWGEAGVVVGVMDVGGVDGDVVINKDITVTNSSVTVASVEGYTKKTATAGETSYVVVKKDGGKARIATANFAFLAIDGSGNPKVQTSEGEISAYTALDTLDAFKNAQGTK